MHSPFEIIWLTTEPCWAWKPHYETLSIQRIRAAKNKLDIPNTTQFNYYNKDTQEVAIHFLSQLSSGVQRYLEVIHIQEVALF